jgi:mono/diheme cytochrome c family protein
MDAPGPPQTELEIDVLAFRYGWQFTYPEYNIITYQLNVPVNQRILIKLQSLDVVHSFWVPQWGPKQDAVPGMTTEVRYTPDQIGQFTLYCSQLCGYGHSYMTAPVYVTSLSDFQTWVQQQQQKTTSTPTTTAISTTTSTAPPTTIPTTTFQTLAASGQIIYSNSCSACHGASGEGGLAPALWGAGATLGAYSGVMLFTNAQDMLNFISAKMPLTAPGSLSAEQYQDVLAYILVQDNKVSASDLFVQSQLSNITLP